MAHSIVDSSSVNSLSAALEIAEIEENHLLSQSQSQKQNVSTLHESKSHVFTPSPTPLLFHEPDITLWRQKVVLVLVGLPARGKSYLANKIVAYLRWRGLAADLFNVGKFRRTQTHQADHSFFDAKNVQAKEIREQLAMQVLEQLLKWMKDGGNVAVFDATNTTEERRRHVLRVCKRESAFLNVIFLESVCDDIHVLEDNYRQKAMHSPDYKALPLEEALKDLRLRIAQYEKVYQPLRDDTLSYIRTFNLSTKIVCNRVYGAIAHNLVNFLMSIHVHPRPIYLVRAGHTEGAEEKPEPDIDSVVSEPAMSLSEPIIPHTVDLSAHLDARGRVFAEKLSQFLVAKCAAYWDSHDELWSYLQTFIQSESAEYLPATSSADAGCADCDVNVATRGTALLKESSSSSLSDYLTKPKVFFEGNSSLPLVVYTSTAPRATETIEAVASRVQLLEAHSCLNMLDMGSLHRLSLEKIKRLHPHVLEEWAKDRYHYRFPGGESQHDKARALVPLVMEIERQRFPTVIVSHSSTLQVLYGYFLGLSVSPDSYYALNVPRDVVIELIPNQYGFKERRYDFRAEVRKRASFISSSVPSTSSSETQTQQKMFHPISAEKQHGIQHYAE